MKRMLSIVTICALMLALLSTPALAGGVRVQNVKQGAILSWKSSARGNVSVTLYCDGKKVGTRTIPVSAGECKIPNEYMQQDGEYTACFDYNGDKWSVKVRDTEDCATTTSNKNSNQSSGSSNTSNNGSASSDLASQVVAQVNAERAKQGLSALTVDSTLTAAACVRAKEIVQSFSHTRPDGTSWSTVSSKAYGENIAKGQKTADKVMAAWMSSSGHKANILRSSFGSIGVCAYEVNGVVYWVQLFGR